MKNIAIYIVFLLGSFSAFAQEELSRVDKSEFSNADFYFYQERYSEAYSILVSLYEKYDGNPEIAFRLGVCELELFRNKEKASALLSMALQLGNKESLFYLGKIQHLNHKFDEAISLFNEYKKHGSREQKDEFIQRCINSCQEAKNLTNYPEDVMVINLGETVNSKYAEYVPLITSAEDELYFTSRRDNSTGGKRDPNNQYFEDVYYTKKNGTTWGKPTNTLSDINTETHDATAAISADGKSMLIYRTNKQLTGGDLYITNKVNDKWKEPKMLDEHINSEFQEASACFSPDGNTLYFSSNRPGGFGGKDIYRVRMLPNKEWSLPKNLGAAVNTQYDEDSPFLDVDDRTLYFASEGHNSMGGYDIFISKRQGKETWSTPENLGFPANSVEDDIYLSLTPGGKKGYYSSEKANGYGDQDLYEINFIYRQKTNLVVKGTLTDAKGQPIKGELTVIDERNKDLQGVYNSNKNNGKYVLLLNPMVKYKVIIQAEGRESITKDLYFDFPEEENHEIDLKVIVLN